MRRFDLPCCLVFKPRRRSPQEQPGFRVRNRAKEVFLSDSICLPPFSTTYIFHPSRGIGNVPSKQREHSCSSCRAHGTSRENGSSGSRVNVISDADSNQVVYPVGAGTSNAASADARSERFAMQPPQDMPPCQSTTAEQGFDQVQPCQSGPHKTIPSSISFFRRRCLPDETPFKTIRLGEAGCRCVPGRNTWLLAWQHFFQTLLCTPRQGSCCGHRIQPTRGEVARGVQTRPASRPINRVVCRCCFGMPTMFRNTHGLGHILSGQAVDLGILSHRMKDTHRQRPTPPSISPPPSSNPSPLSPMHGETFLPSRLQTPAAFLEPRRPSAAAGTRIVVRSRLRIPFRLRQHFGGRRQHHQNRRLPRPRKP